MAGGGRFAGVIARFSGRVWSPAVGRDLDEMLRRVSDSVSNLNSAPLVVEDVLLGSTGDSVGTSKRVALDDHIHNLHTAAPTQPTGKTAAEGTALTALRSDARIAQGINSAKGDILTHDGSTAERLPVGTNGQRLVADSTQTTGLAWQSGDTVSVVTKTGNYAATAADDVILCDATAGAMTITFPAAATIPGKRYALKKVDVSANAVTLDPNGAETIDGSVTQSLAAQWQALSIVSNGTAFFILGFNV